MRIIVDPIHDHISKVFKSLNLSSIQILINSMFCHASKITTKPKITLDNKGKFIIVKLGNKKKMR